MTPFLLVFLGFMGAVILLLLFRPDLYFRWFIVRPNEWIGLSVSIRNERRFLTIMRLNAIVSLLALAFVLWVEFR